MPLYEYKCEQCGTVFEKMQRFSDAPLTQHENCGGSVVRLISAPALQFKGSGWYITDYSRSGSGGEKKADSKSESKQTSTSEAKPASSSNSGSSGSSSGSSSTSDKT